MEQTYEFLACHPAPDQNSVQRHSPAPTFLRWMRRTSGARVSTGASGRTTLEKDDKVLRGIEYKVLDTHIEVVDEEPRLVGSNAR